MTLNHRRKFTREFKLQVMAEIAAGKSLAQAAREHQLHPTLIGRWQKQHLSIRVALSLAKVVLTRMKLASKNLNAWLAASRWKTTC